MSLAAAQTLALERLRSLLLAEVPGLREVYTEQPDAITVLPCIIVFDDGFLPIRYGQWQEIQWRLRVQGFVAVGKLRDAIRESRVLRGNLVDALDFDLTLGGAVSRCTWDSEGLRLAGLEYPAGTEYAGLDGRYTLWIKEAKAFT